MGPRPPTARGKQFGARLRQQFRDLRRRFLETLRRVADGVREIEDILSSKDALRVRQGVAALLHAVNVIEDFRLLLPERAGNLIFGPDVKRALSLLFWLLCVLGAFGVLGGIETAFFAD